MKTIGWIFVPFMMIFLRWKSLSAARKAIGLIWSIYFIWISYSIISVAELNASGEYDESLNVGLKIMLSPLFVGTIMLILGLIVSNASKNKALLAKTGAENVVSLIHVSGLNVGTTECRLFLFQDKLQIESMFTNEFFEIPIASIYQAAVENVRKGTGFSLGKAAIGEAIAGPIAAVVLGSRGGSKATPESLLKIGFINKDKKQKELIFHDNSTYRAITFASKLRAKTKQVEIDAEPTFHQL